MLAFVARYVYFLAAVCVVHTATDRNLAVPSLTAPTRKALPGLFHCISMSFHGNSARASNGKQRSWLKSAKNIRLIARKTNKQNLFSNEIPSLLTVIGKQVAKAAVWTMIRNWQTLLQAERDTQHG